MNIKKFLFISLLLFTTSCVWGPNDPNRTYADNLNGEHTDSAVVVNSGAAVILADTPPIQRRITGKIFCGEGISAALIRKANVELKNDSKVIAQAAWREDGSFLIRSSFNRNINYSVTVKAPCGEASRQVPVNLLSDLTEFDFYLN